MRTIDLLTLKLQRTGGGSVKMFYPIEELEPGLKLLKARRCPDDNPWPEIEVVSSTDFSVRLKVSVLDEDEFPAFETTLDQPFILDVEDVGEMTFTLEEEIEDDDGRWDAWS